MTTIRNFFSPTKTSLAMTPSPVQNERKPIPATRPDNKLIVSNMKSVINSVKLHKKHKKRKRNVDEAPEIHDISNILQSNLSFISPNRTEPQQNGEKIVKESTVIAIPEVNSIDSHTSTIASEDSSKENNSVNGNVTPTYTQSIETKSQSASNAFEFMMTARHKSIGTNSPGKELTDKETKTLDADREVNVKRKLMLEEWADRKGRAKKRLNEAADDEYIDMVMAKRAKRLRTLLKNGKKQKEIEAPDDDIIPTKPSNELKLKVTKGKNRIEDSEDDGMVNHKTSTKSSKRLSQNGKRKATNSVVDEIFVEHLSSPLKKRDSLLGYFSKLTKTSSVDDSPASDNITKNPADSPVTKSKTKKRGRPTLPVDEVVETQSVDNLWQETLPKDEVVVVDKVLLIADQTDSAIPSSPLKSESKTASLSEGRPKRLCRDKKISYLIDEDFNTPNRSREKKVSDKNCATPKAAVKPSKPTKLAPIFAKAPPKPFIDPTVLRARHEFLMSGIPEKMKLEMEKQRQFEEFYETEFEVFPKISHVGHHTASNSIVVDLAKMNIRFKPPLSEETAPQSFRQNNLLKVRPPQCDSLDRSIESTKIDQKDLMRQLKQKDASEFPYYRCFKQLKRRNPTNQSEDEAGCDNSVELVVEKVASANGNKLFTEKYRPLISSEVLLNTKPLIELQKFLSSWKENMDGRECANSSDEFDTNSNSGTSSINKAIVLTGPPGCGKSMFVSALANEMNFKVLEINAGAKRTGKKVLKKLQEATQSHHVNNNQCSQSDRSKGAKSTKYNQSEDSEPDSGTTQKQSLILIEDAEVVFDDEVGFVESINQLVTITKRPVILITNQINCPHLSRFINRNMLSFRVPKSTTASKWLSTLSVAEQCYVTEDMCGKLYQRNNFDFRKTLLELQFFIQSTNRTDQNVDDTSVVCTSNKLRDLFFNNQNQSDGILPFPVDFTNLDINTNRILSQRNVDSESSDTETTKGKPDTLTETIDFFNIISTAQWFEQKTDSSDRVVNHLNDEISHFMVEQSFRIRGPNLRNYEDIATIRSNTLGRPQQLAPTISSRNNHSTRDIDLDIEPCLRQICRSELLRSHRERRSSRFYHYLRGMHRDSFGTKSFDDHCLTFSNE